MRLSCPALLVALGLALATSTGKAQFYPNFQPHQRSDVPFSIGGYIQFGVESPTPPTSSSDLVGTIGLYGELNLRKLPYLHPGLDLRGTGSADSNVAGTLVGPRLAFSYSVLHPYVEALVGPNHIVQYQLGDHQGITASFVAGLDFDYGTNIRWRVLEYSQGHFTGVPNSNPRTVSSGFVIVFP